MPFLGSFYGSIFFAISMAVSVNQEPRTSLSLSYENAGESPVNGLSSNGALTSKTHLTNSSKDLSQMTTTLEEIKNRLRSFVHDTVFDRSAFLESSNDLALELGKIELQIDKGGVVFQEARADYDFCIHLFSALKDAAVVLPSYESRDDLAKVLVFKTVQLNIKLLTLYKSLGVPDPSSPGYAKAVFRSVLLLNEWHRIFTELHTHPDNNSLAFRIQYSQAKESLQVLMKYVP